MNIYLNKPVSLVPPLFYALSSIKEYEYFYKHYETRHPAAIFNLRCVELLQTYNKLCKEVANYEVAPPDSLQLGSDFESKFFELKSLTIDLLLELMNYFDCGYEIFLCFCGDKEKPNRSTPLHKWFKKVYLDTEIKGYFENINPHLERYRLFFNSLKHSSNDFRIYQFRRPNNMAVLGFYLETVSSEGTLSPDVNLHPTWKDAYTAWSFNCHLRGIYHLVYKIADEMNTVIGKLCKTNSITLSPTTSLLVNPNFEEVCRNAHQIVTRVQKSEMFPQEYDHEVPSVSVELNEDEERMTFNFARQNIPEDAPHWKPIFSTKGDGFSRSFTMLYTKSAP